jgi:hypothetical protein
MTVQETNVKVLDVEYCNPLHGPGDIVNITGIFLPKPFTGFKVTLLIPVFVHFENEIIYDVSFAGYASWFGGKHVR